MTIGQLTPIAARPKPRSRWSLRDEDAERFVVAPVKAAARKGKLIQAGRRKINLYWAGAFVALGVFVLFVFAATGFGILIDPIPLRGQTYLPRAIRALATLLIGIVSIVECLIGLWLLRGSPSERTRSWALPVPENYGPPSPIGARHRCRT